MVAVRNKSDPVSKYPDSTGDLPRNGGISKIRRRMSFPGVSKFQTLNVYSRQKLNIFRSGIVVALSKRTNAAGGDS